MHFTFRRNGCYMGNAHQDQQEAYEDNLKHCLSSGIEVLHVKQHEWNRRLCHVRETSLKKMFFNVV